MTPEFCILEFCRETYFSIHHLEPSTQEDYLAIAKSFRDWWRRERQTPMSGVRPEDVGRYLQWLQQSGRCGAIRAAGHRRVLRALLRAAKKRGIVKLKLGELPRVKAKRPLPRAWSQSEFERLVKAAALLTGFVGPHRASDWFTALLLTIYVTDWRITCTMGLKSANVSLESGLAIGYEPKTDEERLARLGEQCVSALKKIFDPAREEVFGDWRHDRRSRQWKKLNAVLAGLIQIAGVPDIGRFHAIRKTATTMVYGLGGLEAARQFAGHRSGRTTLDHYVDKRHVSSGQSPPVPALNLP